MVSFQTKKNWLPFVFGPALAMATVPAGYDVVPRFSSLNWYPGPPLPVPVGSPHCRIKICCSVSRWQWVPLKYPRLARKRNDHVVQGVTLVSIFTVMTPWFV